MALWLWALWRVICSFSAVALWVPVQHCGFVICSFSAVALWLPPPGYNIAAFLLVGAVVLWAAHAARSALWRCGVPVQRCGAVAARSALWRCDLLVQRCGAVALWEHATAPQH